LRMLVTRPRIRRTATDIAVSTRPNEDGVAGRCILDALADRAAGQLLGTTAGGVGPVIGHINRIPRRFRIALEDEYAQA
jgi:hypothetical protein